MDRNDERCQGGRSKARYVRHLSKALDLVGSLPEAPRRLEEELARVRRRDRGWRG